MAECYSLDVVEGNKAIKLVIIKRVHDSKWYLSLRQAFNACAVLGDKSSWGSFYKRMKNAPRAVVVEASKEEIGMLVRHGALSPLAPSASLVSAATLLVAQRNAYALPPALGTALAQLVHGTAKPTPLGPQQVGAADLGLPALQLAPLPPSVQHPQHALPFRHKQLPRSRPPHPKT